MKATMGDMNKIIKTFHPRKATGHHGTPIKVIKISQNVIDSHLTNKIYKDLDNNKFSENAKIAAVI